MYGSLCFYYLVSTRFPQVTQVTLFPQPSRVVLPFISNAVRLSCRSLHCLEFPDLQGGVLKFTCSTIHSLWCTVLRL